MLVLSYCLLKELNNIALHNHVCSWQVIFVPIEWYFTLLTPYQHICEKVTAKSQAQKLNQNTENLF